MFDNKKIKISQHNARITENIKTLKWLCKIRQWVQYLPLQRPAVLGEMRRKHMSQYTLRYLNILVYCIQIWLFMPYWNKIYTWFNGQIHTNRQKHNSVLDLSDFCFTLTIQTTAQQWATWTNFYFYFICKYWIRKSLWHEKRTT